MKNITLGRTPVTIYLSLINKECLRVTLAPSDSPECFGQLNGNYLTEFVKEAKVSETVSAIEDRCSLSVGGFSVEIVAQPLSIYIEDESNQPVQKLQFDGSNGDVTFPLGAKEIYGLGQGFPTPMDRRGEVYDLKRHGQERSSVFEYATITAVPYIVSREGWGLFFHEPTKGTIDLSSDTGRFSVLPEDYRDIFVMRYIKPESAATLYYDVTGRAPLPPKYAFGYQQSFRELYHNGESIVLPTARYMRENRIPCDVLIYLGRYVQNGWNTYTHNGMFEFNKKAFPEPTQIIDELHGMHYKVAFHITEAPTGLHGNIDDTDVNPLEYDHVRNYWRHHVRFSEYAGNDGWWPDDGDSLDLTALHARHKMYHDGTEQISPNKRGFFLQRNSYSGYIRFGSFIWSGDVLCTWKTLEHHVHVGINVAMSLSPFWGSDIGGFFLTEEFSGELYVRWFEYAAFTPLFRSHGRHSFLHTPWGWKAKSLSEIPDEYNQSFGSNMCDAVLPDDRVEPICKKYIDLRYRLMPYIYSLARQAYDKGMPLIRPLWFRFPDDEKAATCESQYMFGNALLVNPVTRKAPGCWTTYLPAGKWYDFFTEEAVEGGTDISRDVSLEEIPVYVPAGSLIPFGAATQFIDDLPIDPMDDAICVYVYEGANGSFTLYEDDGITKDYTRGQGTYTRFVWDNSRGELSISGKSSQVAGRSRAFAVRFVESGEETTVTCVYESHT